MMMSTEAILALVAVGLWGLILCFNWLWKPWSIRRHYEKEGVGGPAYRPVIGNLLEIRKMIRAVPAFESDFNSPAKIRVSPEIYGFSKAYGKVSVHQLGSVTRLLIVDPEMAKQVLVTKASHYTKSELIRRALKPVLGDGVVMAEGEIWRQQRRILNPAFRKDYMEGLMKHMIDAGEEFVDRWRSKFENSSSDEIEVEAHSEMSIVTLDIISRTAFGASVGASSKAIPAFECLDRLLASGIARISSFKLLIPGWLPTPEHIREWKQEKYVNTLLKEIVEDRRKQKEPGNDLLGMMLEALGSPAMSMQQLLDECKTIFFAGHTTTALVLTWSLVMLSIHQKWQDLARQEIQRHPQPRTVQDLSKLEVVTMIINETMRLFPPITSISRECQEAHYIGNVLVIPGTTVTISFLVMQQNEELWGEDVYEFNPERFRNDKGGGGSFMPFGVGPRMCLGMNFALVEAKLLLSLLLANFSFTLSPSYRHAPGIRPKLGAPLIVKPIKKTC